MADQKKLINIKEASSMLGVTALTLRNWDKAGKLTPLRHPINNYRVYRREDIEKLLEVIGNNTKPAEIKRKNSPRKLQVRHLGKED